jgi:predicted porin
MLKYETPRWGAAVAFDRNYGGGGTPSSLPTSSLTDTRAVINGYVKFHTVTLGAGFQRRINHGIQAPGVSNVSSDYSWLGAQYLLHPQVMLDAQVGHLDVQDRPLGGSVIAARAMYLLSKRTAVYVTAGRVFNERNANFTVDGGTANTSSLPLAGVNQTGVMVGVRHSF